MCRKAFTTAVNVTLLCSSTFQKDRCAYSADLCARSTCLQGKQQQRQHSQIHMQCTAQEGAHHNSCCGSQGKWAQTVGSMMLNMHKPSSPVCSSLLSSGTQFMKLA
jgi:hypothetical protein